MHAERLDTLTVLFTDIVESTRLRTTLGERDAEDVLTRAEAVQANVIRSERGRIVKGLGDGILAVFPAADHALRAAGRLAARLDALAERVDVPIDARVGVSAGDVRETDDDVSGTPVIEAARLVAAHLDTRAASATALEQYLDCPHAYLVRHVLRVSRIDNPEELLRISPLERGSLVHDVLDRWLTQRIAEGAPRPDQPWPQDAVAALATLADAALDDAERRGVTGHRLLWSLDRARIAADLAEFVARDTERRRRHGLVPDVTELAFGFASGQPELEIAVGPARRLRVRGFVDRVDVAADGAVYVADYKTGRSSRYRDLADDPFGGGLRLQLPIYGLAARERHGGAPRVYAEYWFITHEGDGARIVHELTDEVHTRLREALRLVVDGISDGLFPMRPPDRPSYGYVRCEYCDPDGLGTTELRRTWERVRSDPALRDYVALVEPEAVTRTAAPVGAST